MLDAGRALEILFGSSYPSVSRSAGTDPGIEQPRYGQT